jgi:hypothetical protein
MLVKARRNGTGLYEPDSLTDLVSSGAFARIVTEAREDRIAAEALETAKPVSTTAETMSSPHHWRYIAIVC